MSAANLSLRFSSTFNAPLIEATHVCSQKTVDQQFARVAHNLYAIIFSQNHIISFSRISVLKGDNQVMMVSLLLLSCYPIRASEPFQQHVSLLIKHKIFTVMARGVNLWLLGEKGKHELRTFW